MSHAVTAIVPQMYIIVVMESAMFMARESGSSQGANRVRRMKSMPPRMIVGHDAGHDACMAAYVPRTFCQGERIPRLLNTSCATVHRGTQPAAGGIKAIAGLLP
jgi:hypothetical protein